MSNNDPFEAFRGRREIELMEGKFREQATVRRERLRELLEHEDDTEELERKLREEMDSFLSESAQAAEQVLGEITGEVTAAMEAQNELRNKLESLVAGVEAGAEAAVRPSVSKRRPLGGTERPAGPIDLRSALERIRRRTGAALPIPLPREPEPEEEPPPDRLQILEHFDAACEELSGLLKGGRPEVGPEVEPDSAELVAPLDEEPGEAVPEASPLEELGEQAGDALDALFGGPPAPAPEEPAEPEASAEPARPEAAAEPRAASVEEAAPEPPAAPAEEPAPVPVEEQAPAEGAAPERPFEPNPFPAPRPSTTEHARVDVLGSLAAEVAGLLAMRDALIMKGVIREEDARPPEEPEGPPPEPATLGSIARSVHKLLKVREELLRGGVLSDGDLVARRKEGE